MKKEQYEHNKNNDYKIMSEEIVITSTHEWNIGRCIVITDIETELNIKMFQDRRELEFTNDINGFIEKFNFVIEMVGVPECIQITSNAVSEMHIKKKAYDIIYNIRVPENIVFITPSGYMTQDGFTFKEGSIISTAHTIHDVMKCVFGYYHKIPENEIIEYLDGVCVNTKVIVSQSNDGHTNIYDNELFCKYVEPHLMNDGKKDYVLIYRDRR